MKQSLRLLRVGGPAAFLACFALACEAPDPALEVETTQSPLHEAAAWGYAFANNASSSAYTPPATYSRSSSGGTIRANRLGTGSYRVDFAGIGGSGGWAFAVAVGGDAKRCTVDSYANSGGTEQVFVKCHNPGGSAANSQFNVYYQRRTATISAPGVVGGYLRAEANGSVVSGTSWNSRGQANSITKLDVGYYVVRFGGLGYAENSTVIAGAYNTSGHCKVAGWGASEDNLHMEAEVFCFDGAGNSVDRKFTVSLASFLSPVGTPSVGYAWFNDPDTTMYEPDPFRRAIVINGTSIGASDTDMSAGNYFSVTGIEGYQYVVFNANAKSPPGYLAYQGGVSGLAMATGYHDTYCKLSGISEVIAKIEAFCFTGNGATRIGTTMNTVYATGQTQ